ncbi:MAG: hypothetical protein IPP03_01745 [Dechloromonas sp.]|nr:hypothetical protein [Candidatus Dechloromonas phosphoritropha]
MLLILVLTLPLRVGNRLFRYAPQAIPHPRRQIYRGSALSFVNIEAVSVVSVLSSKASESSPASIRLMTALLAAGSRAYIVS